MPKTHVISFHPDGSVEWTRNSDLTLFDGEGEMVRVTDICKRKHSNEYFIQWLLGPFEGMTQTYNMADQFSTAEVVGTTLFKHMAGTRDDRSSPIFFPSYEDAVNHEVAMLNEMRRKGVTFHDKAA